MWLCIILVSQLLVLAHQAPAGAPRTPNYQYRAPPPQSCPSQGRAEAQSPSGYPQHGTRVAGQLDRMKNRDDLPHTNFGYPNQIGGTGDLAQAHEYREPPFQSCPSQGRAVAQSPSGYPQPGTRVAGPLLSDAYSQRQFQPSPEEVESYQRQMKLEREFQDRPEFLQEIRDMFHRARLNEKSKARLQANSAVREEIRRQREEYQRQQLTFEAQQEKIVRKSLAMLRAMESERNEIMDIASPATKDLDEGDDANYDKSDRSGPAVRSKFSDHRARGRNPNASRRNSRYRSQGAESRLREADENGAAEDQENPVVQDEPMGEENQGGQFHQPQQIVTVVDEVRGCPVVGSVRGADIDTYKEGQAGADSPSSSPRGERNAPEGTSSPGSGRGDPEKRPADKNPAHQGPSRRRRVNG